MATDNWKLVTADAGIHVDSPPHKLELLHASNAGPAKPLDVDVA